MLSEYPWDERYRLPDFENVLTPALVIYSELIASNIARIMALLNGIAMNHCDDSSEADFIRSWDDIKQLFTLVLQPGVWKNQLLQFVALRKAGYDRKLRAGQSLFALVLSRSRHHGLRPGQPYLAFYLHDGVIDIHEWDNVQKDAHVQNTQNVLPPLIKAALSRLLTHPID